MTSPRLNAFSADASPAPASLVRSGDDPGRLEHGVCRAQEGAQRRPSIAALARRSGLPLLMLLIIGGTPIWGGYVTLLLAVIGWRLAGVWL